MAKPIFVINYCIDGMSMGRAISNLHELQKVISESNANDDYFTFILPVRAETNVQVFYDKDLNEIRYEELKTMIETKMKSFEEGEIKQEIEHEDLQWDENLTALPSLREKTKRLFKKIF
jgi:hypothetical protein